MTLAELIKNAPDPAATLKSMLEGKQGEELKKSVKALADGGVDKGLLVPYSEDAIESLLSLAEGAAEEAAGDVIGLLDAALEKGSKNTEATPAEPLNEQMVAEIADKVFERLGGDGLKKSLKTIEEKLGPMTEVLSKSARVIAMTLGEDLRKSGRTIAAAPAERSTAATGGSPGKKQIKKPEAAAIFKRSMRLAADAGDQEALERFSNAAILLDALDPRDSAAKKRVNAALVEADAYKKN